MDLNLTDRVFVVTAASSGLGYATARSLVAEGARVVLVARREEVLVERARKLGTDRAVAVVGDLAEPLTPVRACEVAMETWDRLDGAFISVGGPPAGTAATNTDDEWRGAFESVFLAAVRTMDAVLRYAKYPETAGPRGVSGPAIGLVLSSSAKLPINDLTISNGLRPGLASLISQYSTTFGPIGARVFGLMPGKIGTDRMQQLWSLSDDPAAAKEATEDEIPLGRIGTPEEFGRIATFLLSPAASYVSGCVIPVDGGLIPMP
ncbi:SDR family oxidoreductase [Propioniferax innocua]|uniref:3-oxoacyl-[acyl-carrier protein] reductase n=1 Tax=Propioniferax innocua TaxID=1753 RepID=A0A542ZAD0_9ACTN|nr:SDR family oxidoreductase [Propioniferax innocua]TQL57276.1 3-oxoacyl-[acyl-carrier protein] reductase [Propioniferax innocua]